MSTIITELKSAIMECEKNLEGAKNQLSNLVTLIESMDKNPLTLELPPSNDTSSCEDAKQTCIACVDDVRNCRCGYTYGSEYKDAETDVDPCYYCGEYDCRCVDETAHFEKEAHNKTILRWTRDEKNYIVAITTAYGVLQIKTVVDNVVNTTKRLFISVTHWNKSLPVDGTLSFMPYMSSLKKKIYLPLKKGSDGSKLKELEERFKNGAFFLTSPTNSGVHITSHPSKIPMILVTHDLRSVSSFRDIIHNYTLTVVYRKKTYNITHLTY